MRSLVIPFAAIGLAGGWLFADALSTSMHAQERWILTGVTPFAAALLGHWLGRAGRPSYLALAWLTPLAGMLNGLVAGAINERSPLCIIAGIIGLLWALPFLPPLAIVVAAARRVGRARVGSILDAADRRRVWSATLAAIALGSMGSLVGHDFRVRDLTSASIDLVAIGACALGLAVFAALDTLALLRVRRFDARATRPRTPMPAIETIDFGMLDDESEEPAGASATYRDPGTVLRAYRGNAGHARRLLAGHVALDVTSLVLAFAAMLARQ